MTARLALVIAVVLATGSAGTPSTAAPGNGALILYSSSWSGLMQIYAVDPARTTDVGQVTFGGDGFADPHPSPDGRRLAYFGSASSRFDTPHDLWLARANGTAARLVARGPAGRVAWSPDSRLLAYGGSGKWHVVRANGSGDRVVTTAPSWIREPGVSPNGLWRATPVLRSSRIVALQLTNERLSGAREIPATSIAAWSPDSRRIAFTRESGVHVMDVRNGRVRRLTGRSGFALTWSPDGRSIAFVEGTYGYTESTVFTSATGDLLVVDLLGHVRTVVAAERRYGGTIVSFAWAEPPARVRYRAPEPAPPTRVSATGLLAGGGIDRLAADGRRVAFVSCEGVFSWTPSAGDVTTLRPTEPLSTCHRSDRWGGYSLAVAGDRVAYGEGQGCHTINLTLRLEVLAPSRSSSEIARGRGRCGHAFSPGVGLLVGSGDLLAFSTWDETCSFPPGCASTSYMTMQQQVQLVGSQGCPCPVLASSPGPLIPADANEGRVVAFGENETLLLDRDGRQRLSIPVSPLGAQLSGSDLVLLRRGELRHYDAVNGALLRTTPVADVPGGARCEIRCAPAGQVPPRLILEDLARGLVAYVLDGRIHVLRLADGADTVVARGTLARFMDAGLVYADGSRLRLVPFDRLPLR